MRVAAACLALLLAGCAGEPPPPPLPLECPTPPPPPKPPRPIRATQCVEDWYATAELPACVRDWIVELSAQQDKLARKRKSP